MPAPGEMMRKYCAVCGHETCWEYVVVQLEDGVFGFQNLVHPEGHQIKLWRCLNHTTSDGRMLVATRAKRHAVAHDVD